MVEKLSLKLHVAFSLLGLIGGIAGFFVFVFAFYNFHAGIWSLIAGIMATFSLHIHHMDLKDQLSSFYTKDRFKFTGLLGIFMSFVTLIAMISYLVISAVKQIPMMPVENSLILAGVQSFLSFKWSVSLVYFSRKHYKTFDHSRLLDWKSNSVHILCLVHAICTRASNVEIGVECQIFVIVSFFNWDWVLQFGAHTRYYKGALTQKRWFLVVCTSFRSDFHVGWKNQNKHSALNSSFDTLSKWYEPDIRLFQDNLHNWVTTSTLFLILKVYIFATISKICL